MTVAKVVSDGYTTPKSLMDISHISPLIVLMVRDGVLYYCLYVTAHLRPLFLWCLLFVARMFGVFTRQLRGLQLTVVPPDPAILLITIIFMEIAQGLVTSASLPYVLFCSNILWGLRSHRNKTGGWLSYIL